MTQLTETPTAQRVEEILRPAYLDNERIHTTDEDFKYGMQIIRTAVANDIAAFLDTMYQPKAADLIRAKARTDKFVNGTS